MADRLDELETLGVVGDLLLAAGFLEGLADLRGDLVEVQPLDELADRVGAHLGAEGVAVLLDRLAVLVLGHHLLVLQLGVTRVDDDIVLVVDDLLEVAGLHAQQRAQTARQALEEPDVHDGRRQVDVPHPLAADAAVGDLDAAAVADDALVLGAAVLAAGALVVALGTEDPLAEQPVLLGPVGAVVDGLGLFDLAVGPRADVVGRREGHLDGAEVIDAFVDGFSHVSFTFLRPIRSRPLSDGPSSSPKPRPVFS